MEEHKHTHTTENPDSIDLGGGAGKIGFKVYGDFAKPDEFKKKIDEAKKLRVFAAEP